MKKIIAVSLLCFLFSGCFTREFTLSDDKMTVMDYGADRRGSYIYKTTNGYVIVSEPAPDIAKEITTSMGLSAKTIGDIENTDLKYEYASKVIDLANRSQTLQILREALFRLSEMGASSTISTKQRIELFNKVLVTTRIIAATEFVNIASNKGLNQKAMKGFLGIILEDVGKNIVDKKKNNKAKKTPDNVGSGTVTTDEQSG